MTYWVSSYTCIWFTFFSRPKWY